MEALDKKLLTELILEGNNKLIILSFISGDWWSLFGGLTQHIIFS